MEAFLVSLGVGALSEIGDKTQLLAVVLAAKFRKPLPIILGILAAALLSHTIAVAFGAWLSSVVDAGALRWSLGFAFVAMAMWTAMLNNDAETTHTASRFGAFATTLVSYSLMEFGDKTQIATVILAAKYSSFAAVLLGTTCGMVFMDVPAVLLGKTVAGKLPMRWVRGVAASIFAVLGLLILFRFDAVIHPV